jgi:sigma-B regulation protein RsbU (phosphoserine phosphatase)
MDAGSPQIPEFSGRDANLKQLEFQAVYDLSLAITKNQPEEGLFQVLESYLLEQLGIGHFSIFNLENGSWHNSFCYGKMIAGWKSLEKPEQSSGLTLLRNVFPELQHLNPHVELLIPFHFDGETGGLVLCQRPQKFHQEAELEAVALIQTLSGLMLMARENQKLLAYRLRQESLRKEMEIARQVQKMLFPSGLPDTDKLYAYATYLPHGDVSGDYYDFIRLGGDDFAICVADVSGKGMPAALLMSNFQASLRTLLMDFSNLAEIIPRINRLIRLNGQGERFITAFIAVYHSKEKMLHYVNCGHIPPCLVSADGNLERLSEGSAILGIFDPLPVLTAGQKKIYPDSLLSVYTDGLAEIEDENGAEFGLSRIEAYFLENRNEKMPVLHQRLLNRLDNFACRDGFSDDLTLFTLRFGG